MSFSKIFLGCCAAAALSFGIAHAGAADTLSSITDGSYSVKVWTGNGVTSDATLPAPSGAATYSFTYTGPIDFSNNAAANTFADFGFSAANVSGLSSTKLSKFLKTTMSTSGFVDNSYLIFAGTYTAGPGTSLSIDHDDGASFYTDGMSIISSGNPTTEITSSGMLPSGTHKFRLVYVEANGAPADLITSVPEPGSLALLGTGLIGLGLIIRRRRKA